MLALVVGACGSPSADPGGASTTTAGSSDFAVGERLGAGITTEDVNTFESATMADVVARSGIIDSLGATGWAEFEAFLRLKTAEFEADHWSQYVSSFIAPAANAQAGAGAIGLALAWGLVEQNLSSGLEVTDSGPVEGTMERVEGNERSVGNVTWTMTSARSGSRITATVDITLYVDVFDASSGASLRTASFHTAGTVEIDFCPDAGGAIVARGSLTMEGTAGATSATSTADINATGTVGDDAYLQSVDFEGSAGESLAGGGETIAGFDGSITMGPQGGLDGNQVTRDAARLERDTANATQATRDSLSDRAAVVVGIVLHTLSNSAQAQWRDGACVEIQSTDASRAVDADEQIQFTASLHHRFDGTQLNQPIFSSFSGVASLDPVDIAAPAPVLLSFRAGSTPDDTGTIHLKSTSKRGIAELDLTFQVEASGWLLEETFAGGSRYGQKCGDPDGVWEVEGIYDRLGIVGSQTWYITIVSDGTSGYVGDYRYTDRSEGYPAGSPFKVFMEGGADGHVRLTFDADGNAVMDLREYDHAYESWVEGFPQFVGTDVNAALTTGTMTWRVGGNC